MTKLSKRIVLITGASRGIGAAIAERFAAEGAQLALVARTLDAHDHLPGSLKETEALVSARGGSAKCYVCDLCDATARAQLVDDVLADFGRVDVLINNAAANYFLPFEKISSKRFEIMFDMNIRAPFDLCQRLIPQMAAHGEGWIVNISTASAQHPDGPPFPHHDLNNHPMLYGMSKAALDRFSTGLASEYFESNVAVNAMAPVGAVATPGAVALSMLPPQRAMIEGVEVMAEAALFLASSNPKQVTGRVCYSGELLAAEGITTKTLDGLSAYDGFIEGVDQR
ncbi:MAG: citronellol/citronellal dehydrogenase [Bacteroidia bacterium]|jgi:citronellol/citronellal dehydrogenase